MPSVLVTGANRGLGLEFARQYAAAGWRVHAACRDPSAAEALAALPGGISRHGLDVTDDGQIAALAAELAGSPLDLLINNAGVNYDNGEFGDSDPVSWLDTLRVNTIAPLRVAEGLIGSLLLGERKVIVNLSSKMASIAENASGGDYAYRTSKAALTKRRAYKPVRLMSDAAILLPSAAPTDAPNATSGKRRLPRSGSYRSLANDQSCATTTVLKMPIQR